MLVPSDAQARAMGMFENVAQKCGKWAAGGSFPCSLLFRNPLTSTFPRQLSNPLARKCETWAFVFSCAHFSLLCATMAQHFERTASSRAPSALAIGRETIIDRLARSRAGVSPRRHRELRGKPTGTGHLGPRLSGPGYFTSASSKSGNSLMRRAAGRPTMVSHAPS